MAAETSIESIEASFLRTFAPSQRSALRKMVAELGLPRPGAIGHQFEAGFIESTSRDYFFAHVDSDPAANAKPDSYLISVFLRDRPRGRIPTSITKRVQKIPWIEERISALLGPKSSVALLETVHVIRNADVLPEVKPLVVGGDLAPAVGVEYAFPDRTSVGLRRIRWRYEKQGDGPGQDIKAWTSYLATYDGQAGVRAWLRDMQTFMTKLVAGAFESV